MKIEIIAKVLCFLLKKSKKGFYTGVITFIIIFIQNMADISLISRVRTMRNNS